MTEFEQTQLLARVEGKLESIDGKLELLDKRLDSIDLTMTKQQVVLDEHVRRTNLLEIQVTNDGNRVQKLEVADSRWSMALKIIGGLIVTIATALGIKLTLGE